MADTPNNNGETVVAPTNGQATSTPTDNSGSDVEKLRQELANQARANQLANEELKKLREEREAREKAEQDAAAKKLAEQNEFKELYEQEKAKREGLETEKQADEARKELAKAKAEVLADYSDEVKALAEETGMTLASADDDAKAAFKEKLDKIQQRIGANGKVTPNNPNRHTGQPQLSPAELGKQLQNQNTFEQIASKMPGIAAMMSPKQ